MLIDAFTYFNEKELVELRLKYLNSIVDYFVVIESNITFTGKEKKWNFPEVLKNNLKEFSHKIQYHQLNIKLEEIKNEESWIIDNIKGDDFWRIENFQRNYIKKACKNFSDDDILIISDLDEIPDSPVKDAIGWVIERGMYVLAAIIGVLILIFLWGILGWLGITVLIVGALIVWLLKWSFLILLK